MTGKIKDKKVASFLSKVELFLEHAHYQEALRLCNKILGQPNSSKVRALIYAYRAKATLLMEAEASHLKAIKDLLECERLEGGSGRAEHVYTDCIESIFSFTFNYIGKSGVLAAINCIPKKKDMLYLLEESLQKKSYFGAEFWKPRGLQACSLDRGTLLKISQELKGVHKLSSNKWCMWGDRHLRSKQPELAMQAYTFALHTAVDNDDAAQSYLGIGNAFFAKNWRKEADEKYQRSIKCNPSYFAPYMRRLYLLANSKNLNDLSSAIELAVSVYEKCHIGLMSMTDTEKEIFSTGIKTMFEKHGKEKIFAAIKLLPGPVQLELLTDTLESKDHFIGQFFWKNRIPFTVCSRNKGTLQKIDLYLQRHTSELNSPVFAQRDSVASLGSLPFHEHHLRWSGVSNR